MQSLPALSFPSLLGPAIFGYRAKKKSPHRKMEGLQKKAAAYSMTARYCKRSEAGTDAGTDHANGVHSMTARYCKRSEAGTDAGTDHANGVHSMTARYCKRSEVVTDAGTDHAQGVPFY